LPNPRKLSISLAKSLPMLNSKKSKVDMEAMFDFQEKFIYGEQSFNIQKLKQMAYLNLNVFNNLIKNQNYELDENLM